MKSKKGGNKKGKKGGGGKKKGGRGKKPPQQALRGDEKPGFVLPEAEKGIIFPGYGCMVTRSWADACQKKHVPLMVEIARANMHRYWDKVNDVQSKASLLHMLGHSLRETMEQEAAKEGEKYNMEAIELIRSMGERSTEDIVYGVWPEGCACGWDNLKHLDPSERNNQMEWIQEMINLTRRTINLELEIFADNTDYLKPLHFLSHTHYFTELKAISSLSLGFDFLNEEDAERWLAIFGKRIEQIEPIYEGKGWDLLLVRNAKASLLKRKCDLYESQGKVELALELVREALEEEGHNGALSILHTEFSLKTGRIEEAFKSLEKILLTSRVKGQKGTAAQQFGLYRSLVPEESQSLFWELIPQYPHVLWAANAAGCVELSEEKKKALQSQLEAKKGLYCVNCNKELTKIYRCSRCDMATYCGSTCQKEAWKEHKNICKKRE
jgi:tetratricopeptide (TPR) repeat protein